MAESRKKDGDSNLYRFGWGLDPDDQAELEILYRPSEDESKNETAGTSKVDELRKRAHGKND